MNDIKDLEATLPGLDCGMCGSPSCRCFAEDVVIGKADVNDCIFNMKNKEGAVIPKPFRTEEK